MNSMQPSLDKLEILDDRGLQEEQIKITDFPNELLLKIATYLSPSQFRNLQFVSKQFHFLKKVYFPWVAKVWNIKDEDFIKDEKFITPITKLYKQIIDAATVKTEDKQLPIQQVDFTTPVPVMFSKYQEQMDRDTLVVANVIAEKLDRLPFSSAEEARQWLNDSTNEHQLAGISELNLVNLNLYYLPPEIGKLTQLEELNLSNNQLTSLSNEFCEALGKLTQLELLFLSNNQFTSLSNEFCEALGKLTQLRALYLFNNQLTSLSNKFCEALGKLTQLELLFLSNNQLKSLSLKFCEALVKLTQLGMLDLSNNQLTSLSNEFCEALVKLTQLEGRLDISNNPLTSLPSELNKFYLLDSLPFLSRWRIIANRNKSKIAALSVLGIALLYPVYFVYYKFGNFDPVDDNDF